MMNAYPERLGAYVNANPSLGDPRIDCPGEALHTMTEIINAITAAGLTPDDADLTQLLQAIKRYQAMHQIIYMKGRTSPPS